MDDYVDRRAFNEGADARLEGLPVSANPYACNTPPYYRWRRGYYDVQAFWGNSKLRRWPIWALPPVLTKGEVLRNALLQRQRPRGMCLACGVDEQWPDRP